MRYYRFILNTTVYPSTVMSTYCVKDICLSINMSSNKCPYSFIFHLTYTLLQTQGVCVCACMCVCVRVRVCVCAVFESGLGMILLVSFLMKTLGHTEHIASSHRAAPCPFCLHMHHTGIQLQSNEENMGFCSFLVVTAKSCSSRLRKGHLAE